MTFCGVLILQRQLEVQKVEAASAEAAGKAGWVEERAGLQARAESTAKEAAVNKVVAAGWQRDVKVSIWRARFARGRGEGGCLVEGKRKAKGAWWSEVSLVVSLVICPCLCGSLRYGAPLPCHLRKCCDCFFCTMPGPLSTVHYL